MRRACAKRWAAGYSVAAPDEQAKRRTIWNCPTMNAAPPDTTSERLLDLQLSFNLYPSQYAHASWLERLGVSDADNELRTSPLWTRSVSSALLRAANLDKH